VTIAITSGTTSPVRVLSLCLADANRLELRYVVLNDATNHLPAFFIPGGTTAE
jgi:hypothetical protein